MKNNIDQLVLGEIYDFDVIADYDGTGVTGKLHLAPDKITVELSGDTSPDRQVNVNWHDREHLVCTTNSGKYILLTGLTLTFASSKTVEVYPRSIGGFELRYEVQNVVFSRTRVTPENAFTQLELRAPAIDKWVGSTSTQYSIVEAYHDGSLFKAGAPIEAQQVIANVGTLRIGYAVETHHSDNFEAGVRFPPKISLHFSAEKNTCNVVEILGHLKDLLSTAIGAPIHCRTIKLMERDGNVFSALSLYIKQPAPTIVVEWPMFALGHNLRHNQFGLPAFPLKCFDEFFSASSAVRNIFHKYVKCRAYVNPEALCRFQWKLTSGTMSYSPCF